VFTVGTSADDAITGDIVRDLDSIAWRLGSAWEEIRPLSYLREKDMAEADRRLNHQAWEEGTTTVFSIGSEALAMREKLTSTLAEDTHSPEGARRAAIAATLNRMRELRAPDPDAISGELLDTYKKALTSS